MSLEDTKAINQKLKESNDVIILLMNNPSLDAMASGLGLYHALKKAEKNITIASVANINTGGWNLPGSTEITNKIGNRNLVISLSVENKEAIDKVSYNLEENGKTFNLIIQPKKGQKPLSSDQVKYSYSGATADLIFTIDTYNFQELGALYENESKLFDEADTVNVTHNQVKQFTTHQLHDGSQSSLSEVMVNLINDLSLEINKESATNLLAGIDVATNNLQSPTVKAETFKTIAQLMTNGGVRQSKPLQSAQKAKPTNVSPPKAVPEDTKKAVPDDWLSPKIYKGSSIKKG